MCSMLIRGKERSGPSEGMTGSRQVSEDSDVGARETQALFYSHPALMPSLPLSVVILSFHYIDKDRCHCFLRSLPSHFLGRELK